MTVKSKAFSQRLVLDVQGPGVPKGILNELMDHWDERGQNSYIEWEGEEMGDSCPITSKFLKSQSVINCLILLWW